MPIISDSQLPKHELPGLEHLTVADPEQGANSMFAFAPLLIKFGWHTQLPGRDIRW